MNYIRNAFLVIGLLIAYGCDPIDDKLEIKNNSKEIIFYRLSTSDSLDGKSPFLNSFTLSGIDTVWDESSNIIFPYASKKVIIIGKNSWEHFINTGTKDRTLRIFVFDKDVLLKHPWDSILDKQIYSHKYTLTVQELEQINWQVNYNTNRLNAAQE